MVNVIGVDEVGRGCLAGPLLVVASIAKTNLPEGLKDSKQLSIKQRLTFFPLLIKTCGFGEGWVSVSEINRLGLTRATRLGVGRALKNLKAKPESEIIVDGHINYCAKKYKFAKALIDADATVPLVSAASIYAKVVRDGYMREMARLYPDYGFETNVGYGTNRHIRAISKMGIIEDLHRLNYAPVRLFAKK